MTRPRSFLHSEALAPADLRLGGRWTPKQRIKNALIRLGIRAALLIADRLPEPALLAAGSCLGRLAHGVLWREAAKARARVRRALPEADDGRIVRASFREAGVNLGHCLMLRRRAARALDRVHVSDHARRVLSTALEGHRGALFVSAHIGPFELIPAAIAELGLTPAIVVRESYDPGLDPIVDGHRCARGALVIHRGEPMAGRRMLRALRAGYPLGILPDLGARVPSQPAPFLATLANLPSGPALLAERTGAPVVLGTLRPLRGHRGPTFELVIEALRAAGRHETHTEIAAALGAAVAACPEQWLWMAAKSLEIAENPGRGLDSMIGPQDQ